MYLMNYPSDFKFPVEIFENILFKVKITLKNNVFLAFKFIINFLNKIFVNH